MLDRIRERLAQRHPDPVLGVVLDPPLPAHVLEHRLAELEVLVPARKPEDDGPRAFGHRFERRSPATERRSPRPAKLAALMFHLHTHPETRADDTRAATRAVHRAVRHGGASSSRSFAAAAATGRRPRPTGRVARSPSAFRRPWPTPRSSSRRSGAFLSAGRSPRRSCPRRSWRRFSSQKLVEDLPAPFARYAASLAAVGLIDPEPRPRAEAHDASTPARSPASTIRPRRSSTSCRSARPRRRREPPALGLVGRALLEDSPPGPRADARAPGPPPRPRPAAQGAARFLRRPARARRPSSKARRRS